MGADVVAPRLRLTFDLLYHRIRRFIGGRRPGAGDIVLRLVEGQHPWRVAGPCSCSPSGRPAPPRRVLTKSLQVVASSAFTKKV